MSYEIKKCSERIYKISEENGVENRKVDVIIPTYKPGEEFLELMKRLSKQDYPIHKILIMNTEETFWNHDWDMKYPEWEVHHVKQTEFDHGGTRKEAAGYSNADVILYMTQDALPVDRGLIRHMVEMLFAEEDIAAVYARQLPKQSCRVLERYTRSFNYPEQSSVKRKKDLPVYGIKTFFCSDVCAAYRKDIFDKTGGFIEKTIFNEDMIYAGTLIQQDYAVAYAAEAKVYHSHNYSCMQQFHRNFDLGVSQAEHPEIFSVVKSESEGISMIKKTIGYLISQKKYHLIVYLFLQSAFKYAGYLAGKKYKKLPEKWILKFTMMPSYWNL